MVEVVKGWKFPLNWIWVGLGIIILAVAGLLLKGA